MITKETLQDLTQFIINGGNISEQEAIDLSKIDDKNALYEAAHKIRLHFDGNVMDTCSIVNARSGKCSEDCKWCSQSIYHKTKIESYEIVDFDRAFKEAESNAKKGVNRFSLVTSGRSISNHNLDKLCSLFKKLDEKVPMHLCASMGLLNRQQLQKLQASGVNRYHCNLETAPSFFDKLVTTHTLEEKIETIRTAQSLGMKVCSGGIIGMGESMEQRIELAFKLRELNIDSIPINLLMPIKGTPLEDSKPLSDEEILTSFALFKLINPKAHLRLAGGRNVMKHINKKVLHAGVSASLVGDYLTTHGSNIQQDFEEYTNYGYSMPQDKKCSCASSSSSTDKEKNILENLKYDKEHLWHPYTSTTHPLPTYMVASAKGCTIELETGEKLVDGMSSWWAAVHGYNNPVLNQAAQSQLEKMSHVMFGGLTHQPAIELGKLLIDITPEALQKVFLADSGSVAVEVAMKMALQYQDARGKSSKQKFATIHNGYHGDTWHAMSVCDPKTGMHQIFHGSLPINYFLPQPRCRFNDPCEIKDIAPLRDLLEEKHNELAALILEPIVQGAGGMWFYSPDYLRQARLLCDKYDVLLIADEIATGFGRTGELFACNHAKITPDIMCVGKAITGGYMTLSAVLTNNHIADTISNGKAGVLMHGPTFMGNPLACAVAVASIKLLLNTQWQKRVLHIQSLLQKGLSPCRSLSGVVDVRCLGAIGVVELEKEVNMERIQKAFVQEGVWVRPFGKLVYLMPPFIITEKELSKLCEAVIKVVQKEIAAQ